MNDIAAMLGHLGPTWITALRVLLIAALAWVAARVAAGLIRRFRIALSTHMLHPDQVKRAETLGRALRYLVTVSISLIAGMLILSEIGISVAPLLGAAGVAGLAIGFGAQSLVKDYFTGFFMLLENQMTRGDVVSVADRSGVVEDLTLRHVRLRDYEGNVHYIPNGLIGAVTNMGQGFAYAVIDAGVAYRENLDEVLALMREVAETMRAAPDMAPRILEPVEIVGVERWDDSAVILRCRFKVRPLEQWTVRREYLRRLKAAFDSSGIEIPFPHLTLNAQAGLDGLVARRPHRAD